MHWSYLLLLTGWLCNTGTAYAVEPHPGVERWPIKTSVPAGTDLKAPGVFVPLSHLVELPDVPGVRKDDARYQSQLIPFCPDSLLEGQIIETAGWLHLIAGEDDGDYHIQLGADSLSGSPCLIVEVPKDDPTFVHDPALCQQVASVRAFLLRDILKGKDASASGRIIRPAVYVRVKGQLFYDDAHVGTPPRGKKGMKAGTLWELHPVLEIDLGHG